jgi:hypothetical protein
LLQLPLYFNHLFIADRQAIRNLGPIGFENCYNFLREMRNIQKAEGLSESVIIEGLKKIIENPSDGFLVDQLLFLESENR